MDGAGHLENPRKHIPAAGTARTKEISLCVVCSRTSKEATEGEEARGAVRGHVVRPGDPDTDSGFASQHGGQRWEGWEQCWVADTGQARVRQGCREEASL